MTPHDFIYLASQSPRRRQLLDQLGVRHELLVPAPGAAADAAEALEAVQPGELPADYVQRVTGLKLQAARARLKVRGLPAAPILCSDTTVAIGRRILGTPRTVRAQTPQSMRGFLHRQYRAPEMVVAAAGAVEHEEVVEHVAKLFAPLPAGEAALPSEGL